MKILELAVKVSNCIDLQVEPSAVVESTTLPAAAEAPAIVDVSSIKNGSDEDVDGADFKLATNVYVSRAAAPARNWNVAVAAVPLSATIVPPAAVVYCEPVVNVSESALPTACEGTELNMLIPSAATATSAIRLMFVFVDICFLSLVVTRNFLVAASR
jgi:hypothetical protein